MSWTEQQIQALKKMWGNGFSASDIAKSLGGGLTRNAVIGKAHRLKLSACPAMAKPSADVVSRIGNGVVSSMNKAVKKRVLLRPLPPVRMPDNAAKIPVREMPRPLDVAKRTEGIAVTKAGERHCRWPIGDPRSPEFRFCGCTAHEGLPYCVEHARLAYQTVGKKSRSNDGESSPEFRMSGVKKY
ncbi:MAG: gcrA cell cycle regulator family protein [Alphaproteobacteria bacterium]|nr:gcrA cell cycle regulator family protein [Alphaproteobacteria bacterium]